MLSNIFQYSFANEYKVLTKHFVGISFRCFDCSSIVFRTVRQMNCQKNNDREERDEQKNVCIRRPVFGNECRMRTGYDSDSAASAPAVPVLLRSRRTRLRVVFEDSPKTQRTPQHLSTGSRLRALFERDSPFYGYFRFTSGFHFSFLVHCLWSPKPLPANAVIFGTKSFGIKARKIYLFCVDSPEIGVTFELSVEE